MRGRLHVAVVSSFMKERIARRRARRMADEALAEIVSRMARVPLLGEDTGEIPTFGEGGSDE